MSFPPLYIGNWQISQHNTSAAGKRLYLTEDNGRAVTILHNVGGRFVWRITEVENTSQILLTLMPGGSIYPPPEELALTLGSGIGGMNEMKILVEPARPKYQAQVWELKNVHVINGVYVALSTSGGTETNIRAVTVNRRYSGRRFIPSRVCNIRRPQRLLK